MEEREEIVARQISTGEDPELRLRGQHAQSGEHRSRSTTPLQTVGTVAKTLASLSDLDVMLDRVVTLAQTELNYHNVSIFLVDEEADQLVVSHASCPGTELNRACALKVDSSKQSVVEKVAETAEPFRCDDLHRMPSFGATGLRPGARAELAVPILVEGRVAGVLAVQSNECAALDEGDQAVLEIIASQVAMAIKNNELGDETVRRYRAMVALHQTSLDILKHLDVQQLLEALLRRGVELFEAEEGGLYLCDQESRLIRQVAGHNRREGWVSATLRLGEGITGKVAETGKPLILDNYNDWPGRVRSCTASPNTRVMSVPLKEGEESIGAIVVRRHAQKKPFGDRDCWLLSAFADLSVLALSNAELHTRVKEWNRSLEKRVSQRTTELARAKKLIGVKAQQLRALLQKTMRIQEEERKRIARDMHDSVLQLVTAAHYELEAVKTALESDSTAGAPVKTEAVRDVLREIEEEIRLVIHDLRPPVLDVGGLIPALERRTSRFQRISGIACSMSVQGRVSSLPPEVELALFRVVEEALTNVACHSAADAVSLALRYEPGSLCAVIEDNGRGFRCSEWKEREDDEHLGLLGMRERMEGLGGAMDLWSEPGQGTRLVFWVGIEQRASEEESQGSRSRDFCVGSRTDQRDLTSRGLHFE